MGGRAHIRRADPSCRIHPLARAGCIRPARADRRFRHIRLPAPLATSAAPAAPAGFCVGGHVRGFARHPCYLTVLLLYYECNITIVMQMEPYA